VVSDVVKEKHVDSVAVAAVRLQNASARQFPHTYIHRDGYLREGVDVDFYVVYDEREYRLCVRAIEYVHRQRRVLKNEERPTER
jgi:hypothetical protein